MKVLLTGAAGRLGRRTWEALLEAGHEVRATDCRYRRDLPGRLEVVDLVESVPCYRLIEGCDAIAHLGNIPSMRSGTSAQVLYQTNVAININVFQAAAEMGVNNIAFASSVQVIAGNRSRDQGERPSGLAYLPADGDLPARPGNVYALSKEASEDMLRHYAMLDEAGRYVALRFPWLVDSEEAMNRAARRSRPRGRRWPAPLLDEAMSLLAMEDAGALVCRVVEQSQPGYWQYFPSAREMRPGWTVAEAIQEFYADVPLRQPIDQMTSLVDLTALTEHYDWEPTRTSELIRWFNEQAEPAV